MIIYNEEKKELIIPTGIGNIDNTIYYDEGFTDGYSSGRTDGYHEGYGIGYGNGFDDGFTDGHESGFTDGHESGFTDGHESGFTDGYASGYTDGVSNSSLYESGYTIGYNSGFRDGYDYGYNEGYESGFTEGYNSANTRSLTLYFDVNAQTDLPSNLRINGHDYEIKYWQWGTSAWGKSYLIIEADVVESAFTECYFEAKHFNEEFEIYSLTISGWDADILSVQTSKLSDNRWSANLTTQPFSLDLFEMGHLIGFTDGFNSASTKYQKAVYFKLSLGRRVPSLVTIHQEVYINGRLSPDSIVDNDGDAYVHMSAYTPDDQINTLEFDMRYFAGGAPMGEFSGPLLINGINEAQIVSQDIKENRISTLVSDYRYTLNFNNDPIYDYESYQLGLEACQNNENQ